MSWRSGAVGADWPSCRQSVPGCRVTAVTISQAQFDAATEKIRTAGLQDRVTILLQDYRDMTGTFDKIASIEMLEAVGDNFLETWCAQCHRLLKPDGILAVQMIIVPDGDFADLRRGTDFIQKHIFPGFLLLSVGRMNQAMMRTGDLTLLGLDDMASCYVRTLREWHGKFNASSTKFARSASRKVSPEVELLPEILRGGVRHPEHQRGASLLHTSLQLQSPP